MKEGGRHAESVGRGVKEGELRNVTSNATSDITTFP